MLPQVRQAAQPEPAPSLPPLPETPKPSAPEMPVKAPEPEMEQTALEMPKADTWRMVGELYRTYILVEEGDNAFLIDKHAAHERILFEKLKANQESISGQTLLQPVPVRLSPAAAADILPITRSICAILRFSAAVCLSASGPASRASISAEA